MGKSHAEHQKEYREHLKQDNIELYLKKDRERKKKREALKKTKI